MHICLRTTVVVVLLSFVAVVSSADRCTPAPTQQGHWEWRGGAATAYIPGSIGSPDRFVAPDPSYPSPRHSSGSWQQTETDFWLFGGTGAPATLNASADSSTPAEPLHDGLLNDLWRFSKDKMEWQRLQPALTTGVNRVSVYGITSRDVDASLATSYKETINLTEVRRVEMKEQQEGAEEHTQRRAALAAWPGGRQNPATWVSPLDGSLWMFGGLGYGATMASLGFLNDLWQFDKIAGQWFFRGGSTSSGQLDSALWPGARTGASSWTTPDNKLWLFSGFGPLQTSATTSSNRVRSDLWYFDLNTGLWNFVGGQTYSSTARSDWILPRTDAIVWTPPGQLVWIYGGYGSTVRDGSSNVGYLNDLWAWNTTSLAWAQVAFGPATNTPGFIAERAGVPSGNNRPPARCCAASFMDTTGRLYFYGGFGLASIQNQPTSSADFVADIWVLETAPSFHDRIWTWIGGGVSINPPAPVWPPYVTIPPSFLGEPSNDPTTAYAAPPYQSNPAYEAFIPPGDPPPPHPGARAWVTTWQLDSDDEVWIFGSIGTSPYLTMSQPAYYQDFWAFVFPPTATPPTAVPAPAPKPLPTNTIIWATVAGELFFVALSIIILWNRREIIRQALSGDSAANKVSLDREEEGANFVEMKLMSANGNGVMMMHNGQHLIDNNGGTAPMPAMYSLAQSSPASTTTTTTSNQQYSSGSSGVPSANSSSVTFNGSGPFTRSGRSKSNGTTTTTGTTTSVGSGTAINNGNMMSAAGAMMGKNIQASFDLVIKKKDLEFGNIIGRGSSGTIYAGRWHDHRVAIKQLATEVLIGEREGALQEAKLVSQLRPHPNVIQIFGVCVTKQHVFIVMAKMHSSLDKLIYHVQRRKWLTVERSYKMAMGIVAGMLHLESQGICHRDLAARNVCLSKSGTPCIADFGMSRKLTIAASAAETNTQMGPVAWMAPENFLQKYSSKSDVWSFGIVLYEMLAGSVPHRGTDLHALAISIRDTGLTPSPIPADADPGLVAIMNSCWAFDPNQRPTFAQISKQLRELTQVGVDESEEDSFQDDKLPTSAPSSTSSKKNTRNTVRGTPIDLTASPSTASPHPMITGSSSIPQTNTNSSENATNSSMPYSESAASVTSSSSSHARSDSSIPSPQSAAISSHTPSPFSTPSPTPAPTPAPTKIITATAGGHGDYVTGF